MSKKKDFKVDFHDPKGSVSDDQSRNELLHHTGRAAKAFFKQINKDRRLRYVGNGLFGSETINLEQIHAGLGKADAFVFLPSDDLDHDLKLLSMFVGVQTGDENMFTMKIDGKKRQKPVIVVGENGWWKPVLDLIKHTHFIADVWKDNIVMPIETSSPNDIIAGIGLALEREKPEKPAHYDISEPANDVLYLSHREEPKLKVCVFCSASYQYFTPDARGITVKDDEHNLAFQTGAALAKAGYGVISGAGAWNMMGDVVRGAQSAGGWTGGSNTPHIRQIEGVPGGLDAYLDMPDIYKRMKVMIEGSDGFIIAPGGAGSIQEFLALMHYKTRNNELMKDKPVVILNPKDAHGKGYWDTLVAYAEKRGLNDMFKVASTHDEAEALISQEIKHLSHPLSTSWHELVKGQQPKNVDASFRQAL